jgi:hypothetical protein
VELLAIELMGFWLVSLAVVSSTVDGSIKRLRRMGVQAVRVEVLAIELMGFW